MSRRVPVKPHKATKPLPPNLPQHNFSSPLNTLLTIGNPDDADQTEYDRIAAQLLAGDASKAVSTLQSMALDDSYYNYEGEKDPRGFTRANAVAVLSRMGEAAVSCIEPLLPLLDSDDDYLAEELPFFFAAMGKAAFEPLARVLLDQNAATFLRGGVGECLGELAEQHSEERARVVSLLEQALAQETEDATFAAFLISNLLDLESKESLPLIRQAFEEDRIDESVVQMADVEEHWGLPITKPRHNVVAEEFQRPQARTIAPDEDGFFTEDEDTEQDTREPEKPYVAPPKVGRNEPCPCGSGLKYKKCHGAAA